METLNKAITRISFPSKAQRDAGRNAFQWKDHSTEHLAKSLDRSRAGTDGCHGSGMPYPLVLPKTIEHHHL